MEVGLEEGILEISSLRTVAKLVSFPARVRSRSVVHVPSVNP